MLSGSDVCRGVVQHFPKMLVRLVVANHAVRVIVRGVRVAHGVHVVHVASAVGDCPVPAMLCATLTRRHDG